MRSTNTPKADNNVKQTEPSNKPQNPKEDKPAAVTFFQRTTPQGLVTTTIYHEAINIPGDFHI